MPGSKCASFSSRRLVSLSSPQPDPGARRSTAQFESEPPMKRLSTWIVCLVFLLAASAGTAFAAGKILEAEHAGALRIGLSTQDVEKAMGGGPSRKSALSKAESGEWTQMWEYKKQGAVLLMAAPKKNAPLTLATITLDGACKLVTSRDVHIGSTDRDVRKAYGDDIDNDASTPELIVAGSLAEGGLIFTCEKGKVVRIFIGSTRH